jgi:hypothetical protein
MDSMSGTLLLNTSAMYAPGYPAMQRSKIAMGILVSTRRQETSRVTSGGGRSVCTKIAGDFGSVEEEESTVQPYNAWRSCEQTSYPVHQRAEDQHAGAPEFIKLGLQDANFIKLRLTETVVGG